MEIKPFKGRRSFGECAPEVIALLRLLHAHVDSNAIVGGGFLRDLWIHNKPGKDIDAFVHCKMNLPPSTARKVTHQDFLENIIARFSSFAGIPYVQTDFFFGKGWDSLALAKFEFQGRNVELMFIDKPVSGLWYPARVNFGINQIWCDGKDLHVGRAFEMDQESKTVTLINSASQREVDRNFEKADHLLSLPEWRGWKFVCALTTEQIADLPSGEIFKD